jgi:hypothetical protein
MQVLCSFEKFSLTRVRKFPVSLVYDASFGKLLEIAFSGRLKALPGKAAGHHARPRRGRQEYVRAKRCGKVIRAMVNDKE